jgi:hypothetical protein
MNGSEIIQEEQLTITIQNISDYKKNSCQHRV